MEMDDERKATVSRIMSERSTEELKEWAWGILATSYEDAPVMVAEDPSVMDVLAAYIGKLEGLTPHPQAREGRDAINSMVKPANDAST